MEPAEVQRLEQQHEVWRSLTECAWELAGFGAGQTIVDLGSGPGFTSRDLACLVRESGHVVAVDSSTIATDYLRSIVKKKGMANLEVITADVADVDLWAWEPDGVFARWLFCYLKNPEVVVERIASGLRAGATVAVMDYWNYLAIRMEPDTRLFRKVFQAVYDSFADTGGSLDVAGRLPALFSENGLRVTRTEPLCQVGRPGSQVWRWLSDFQTLYLPTLVQQGYLTPAEFNDYQALWREQEKDANVLLFAPPILCVIGVKR